MDVYTIQTIDQYLAGNTYPGRGILLGTTADGSKAVAAYFIMGRSANSRNRIFVEKDQNLFTEPFDAAKVQDPSLIIYRALCELDDAKGHHLIVTNGDQTDTIAEFVQAGKCFRKALTTRCFEPDVPNYTPRISGMITVKDGAFSYDMSILKSVDSEGSACARYTYEYPSVPGLGHLIHTYVCDGHPVIPSFQGEPKRIAVGNDIDEFTQSLWDALDPDNRISLYVRFIDKDTLTTENRLINKNK